MPVDTTASITENEKNGATELKAGELSEEMHLQVSVKQKDAGQWAD